jgi:hypothetical protein
VEAAGARLRVFRWPGIWIAAAPILLIPRVVVKARDHGHEVGFKLCTEIRIEEEIVGRLRYGHSASDDR